MPFPAAESPDVMHSEIVPQSSARKPVSLLGGFMAVLCNRKKSASERLQQIVESSAACRSLPELSEDPEFLSSIYRLVDHLGDKSVRKLINKYLAEC